MIIEEEKGANTVYKSYNANPNAARVGDCTVRAISKATGKSWDEVYIGLAMKGMELCNMPSANAVWGAYLRQNGFRRYIIPETCPDCYTVSQFAADHARGTYILALSGHVVACVDGTYYDTWDSGDELPIYYWEKKES